MVFIHFKLCKTSTLLLNPKIYKILNTQQEDCSMLITFGVISGMSNYVFDQTKKLGTFTI